MRNRSENTTNRKLCFFCIETIFKKIQLQQQQKNLVRKKSDFLWLIFLVRKLRFFSTQNRDFSNEILTFSIFSGKIKNFEFFFSSSNFFFGGEKKLDTVSMQKKLSFRLVLFSERFHNCERSYRGFSQVIIFEKSTEFLGKPPLKLFEIKVNLLFMRYKLYAETTKLWQNPLKIDSCRNLLVPILKELFLSISTRA